MRLWRLASRLRTAPYSERRLSPSPLKWLASVRLTHPRADLGRGCRGGAIGCLVARHS